MWNRIFKSKSNKSRSGVKAKDLNRCSYYEEFHQSSVTGLAPHKFISSFVSSRSDSDSGRGRKCDKYLEFYNSLVDSSNVNDSENRVMKDIGNKLKDNLDNLQHEVSSAENLELQECPVCSRTFQPKTLDKHISICEKMVMKKRKTFDSSRQRREGTELASYLPKNFGLPQSKQLDRGVSPRAGQEPPVLKREDSKQGGTMKKAASPVASVTAVQSQLERSSRAAKRIQPPPSEKCPHCERFFGNKAYDRHVEWCKEKALINAIKNNSNSKAKERLEARTKYRAPCLKTKRQVNREKYSGAGDEIEEADNHQFGMSTSLSSSFISEGSKLDRNKRAPNPTQIEHLKKAKSLQPLKSKTSTNSLLQRTQISNCVKSEDALLDLTFNDADCDDVQGLPSNRTETLYMTDADFENFFEAEFNKSSFDISAYLSQEEHIVQEKKTASERDTKSHISLNHQLVNPVKDFRNVEKLQCEEKYEPTMLKASKSYVISGLSDKYDPFMSAKRQLEELCSPTSPPSSTSHLTLSNRAKPKIPLKMSTSLSTTSSSSNPKTALNSIKSNFRRTASLRSPRKASVTGSRPLFISNNQRPTIQRGLSDEGPISSNFLKPEEYDEMPVRSVCVNDFAIANSPRVIRRDSSASNRRNLRLNLSKENSPAPAVTSSENPLSKTDSLAVFLKYESAASNSVPVEGPATTKDLKDKSNTLSKQNSAKNILSEIQEVSDTPLTSTPNNSPFKPNALSEDIPPDTSPIHPTNLGLNSIFDLKDSDYIDPKLINKCDNLPMNAVVSKLSDSDLTSDASESATKSKTKEVSRMTDDSSSNRNSSDSRQLRKRRMRLGRNQFLYDTSPEEVSNSSLFGALPGKKLESPNLSEFDDFDFEEFLSTFDKNDDQFPIFKDCREFLFSRTQNKRFNSKITEFVTDSPCPAKSGDHQTEKIDGDKREIFISIETEQTEQTESADHRPFPSNPAAQVEEIGENDNKFTKLEDDGSDYNKKSTTPQLPDVRRNNAKNLQNNYSAHLIKSEVDVHKFCEDPIDSDEISSVECFPMRRSAKSKQSSDSAYGSLSRQSPTEPQIYRNVHRIRPSTAATPERMQYNVPPTLQQPTKKYPNIFDPPSYRNRNFSAGSSSGSDNSLPPINQKDKYRIDRPAPSSGSVAAQSITGKMSRFCHECGNKFVVEQAKFCMECGVKRIML